MPGGVKRYNQLEAPIGAAGRPRISLGKVAANDNLGPYNRRFRRRLVARMLLVGIVGLLVAMLMKAF